MVCSHFLQSRDPLTGVFSCYLCKEKDTIFCMTCRKRNPLGETKSSENIIDIQFQCAVCKQYTSYILAFKK